MTDLLSRQKAHNCAVWIMVSNSQRHQAVWRGDWHRGSGQLTWHKETGVDSAEVSDREK